MIDALGRPQSVLLLGGTSDIAVATALLWAERKGLRVVVAARPSERRDAVVAKLRDTGAEVEAIDFDARETSQHREVIRQATVSGDIDVAMVAFGVLGDEERAWQEHDQAIELVEVNYVGSVSCGIVLADVMREQGHGVIVALSSVAGERVRRSNFVYGSTKAGMDGFYLGLGEALRPHGVRVLVVRPGFVVSKMTEGREKVPLSSTPDDVATAIVEGVASKRELIWVPKTLRGVMSAIRHIPRPVFRRLPL